MAIRPILRYPDPLLRAPASEVTVFDASLAALAHDLLVTMRSVEGLGITACHLGIPLRVVVIQAGHPDSARTYVNPRIIETSAERIRHPEGSVSLPGLIAEVERAARVRIAYQNLRGDALTEEAEGFAAVCHQHEIDQLDGVFWLERLSRLKRERLLKKHRGQGRSLGAHR